MKKLEEIFFKDTLDKFKVISLYKMKTATIVAMVVLIVFYIIQIKGKTGYAVTEKIYPNDSTYAKVDKVFYEVNGLVPIAKSNYIDRVLFSVGEQKSNAAPSIIFMDLIAMILLLVLIYLFITNTIKFGPFNKEATVYLKKSVLLSFVMFIVKGFLTVFMEQRFEAIYDNNYRLDRDVYLGQNWLYVMFVYAFVLNIFNYGRKLQEEVDLTV